MAGSNFLVKHLRRLRELMGLSQDAWAAKVHYSTQHVGGIERGERAIHLDYLTAVDRAFGMTFVEYYEEHVLHGPTPVWLRSWFDHEREADLLRHFETALIPGLLQTRAYAQAIIGTSVHGRAVGLVDGHPEGGVVESQEGVTALERRWESIREYAEPQDRSLELIMKAAESWTS